MEATKELHEQVVKNLLMPKWADSRAINVDPPKLKAWCLGFDVESSTRGKYKSVMSGVCSWGQCEGLIPRGEQFSPCRYVKGREFSQATNYEALVLEIEDTFSPLGVAATCVRACAAGRNMRTAHQRGTWAEMAKHLIGIAA